MRISRIILAVAVALAAVSGRTEDLDTMTVDGKARTLLVYAPKGLPKNPPLVISLHGVGQDAFFQRGQSRWNDCADENKFVVVYPNAINKFWDIFGTSDIRFFEAVIDEMDKRFKIDRNRVYITGFSLGGMMTYQCMEHLSDKVAAFGPVSGVRFDNRPPKSARPVSFMHVHGTGDNVFWWGGDLKHPAGGYPSIPEFVERWAKHEGLDLKKERKHYPRKDSRASLTLWHKKNDTTGIALLAIEDKGHWHSEDPAHSVSTTHELWNFFKRYSLNSKGQKRPARGGASGNTNKGTKK